MKSEKISTISSHIITLMICPGTTASGLLTKAVNDDGVTRMPPAGTFFAYRIRQFEIWVNSGFLNN